jgi:hypothetical protein
MPDDKYKLFRIAVLYAMCLDDAEPRDIGIGPMVGSSVDQISEEAGVKLSSAERDLLIADVTQARKNHWRPNR